MDGIIGLVITWLIMAVSFFIISKLPTGVDIEDFGTALVAAAIFGFMNAFITPVLQVLALPLTILTLGAFAIVVNAIVFGLAAKLVTGFKLRWGIWSALIGAVALAVTNSLLTSLVSNVV